MAGRVGLTPNMTMRSSIAASLAALQTLAKAAGSDTTSAASATTTGSPPRRSAYLAAAAIAGPESRRIGSSRISASAPMAASCSATRKRYCPLVITISRANRAESDTRRTVSWNVDDGPNNGRNCLGRFSRDAGHSRCSQPTCRQASSTLRNPTRLVVRIKERVAHAGLSGEVHDMSETVRREQVRDRGAIGEIALHELEAGVDGKLGEPRLFQRRVVVGVEIVDSDDGAAVGEQALGNMIADEPGDSGDEDRPHDACFLEPSP